MEVEYNHTEYIRTIADKLSVSFAVSSEWKDKATFTTLIHDTQMPLLVADVDEFSRLKLTDEDTFIEYSRFHVYAFAGGDVGNLGSNVVMRREVRRMLANVILSLVNDAIAGRAGLTHLDRSSIETTSLGLVGDWWWGGALTFVLLKPYIVQ
jgi:hypothetical protein